MHPAIAEIPMRQFYEGKVQNGSRLEVDRIAPWNQFRELGPVRYFDVPSGYTGSQGGLQNELQARVAVKLVAALLSKWSELCGEIGILSPYKAEGDLLEHLLKLSDHLKHVE